MGLQYTRSPAPPEPDTQLEMLTCNRKTSFSSGEALASGEMDFLLNDCPLLCMIAPRFYLIPLSPCYCCHLSPPSRWGDRLSGSIGSWRSDRGGGKGTRLAQTQAKSTASYTCRKGSPSARHRVPESTPQYLCGRRDGRSHHLSEVLGNYNMPWWETDLNLTVTTFFLASR